MNRSLQQFHRDVISGVQRGAAAAALRGTLRAIEPIYAAATATRNHLFGAGWKTSTAAARPVVSVGNITTGGTGKTPVVRWLAQRLLGAGRHPAILCRGYKGGDESRMLQDELGSSVPIQANPNRIEGAVRVLRAHPQVDVLLLDDGFQHRKIRREFDLVLISAANPFGFDHVLPRGLLREPLSGLSRASAFLITHADLENPSIAATLQRFNQSAPIYRCRHVQAGLRGVKGESMAVADLRGRAVMTFSGIGNPGLFDQQIRSTGARHVATRWFDDHHSYTPADLSMLKDRLRQTSGEMLITTEKDWVKLALLMAMDNDAPTIYRAVLEIQFAEGDEERLFGQIAASVKIPASPAPRDAGRSLADSRP
jgi:tetraacyldisaccharide 4'-kinase